MNARCTLSCIALVEHVGIFELNTTFQGETWQVRLGCDIYCYHHSCLTSNPRAWVRAAHHEAMPGLQYEASIFRPRNLQPNFYSPAHLVARPRSFIERVKGVRRVFCTSDASPKDLTHMGRGAGSLGSSGFVDEIACLPTLGFSAKCRDQHFVHEFYNAAAAVSQRSPRH